MQTVAVLHGLRCVVVLDVQNNTLLFTVYSVYKHVVSLSCEEKSKERKKVALKNGEKNEQMINEQMRKKLKKEKKKNDRTKVYIYIHNIIIF